MVDRIADSSSWEGYEAEALLACESGGKTSKELLAVVKMQKDGKSESFFRVRATKAKYVDFTSWIDAEKYYNGITEKRSVCE